METIFSLLAKIMGDVITTSILLFMILGFPVSWLISELKNYDRRSRITRGIIAIISIILISIAFSVIDRLNYSTNYAIASKYLVEVTITQLEHGNTENVLSSFKKLQNEFHIQGGTPFKEYDKRVREAVFAMENKK
ncbi:hypothetical protein [Chamaesiphon sp. VAR_48_metabat_135_sub]|uniref:hypothetical protein n=1 Tax=Chamaesiphon sp. VAR_48_metabat_135_sub TaxID=2964699 RepID=UPI00286A06E5|nr:hypothetical protein [Chamaesiphon sp. VAR_48_metabat_135_sub]